MKGLVWGQIYFVLFIAFAISSVCRNCQVDLAPQIVQGMLTFMASTVAACTALWIAYRAYPAQKNIDRDNEIRKECRASYRDFLKSTQSAYKLFNEFSVDSSRGYPSATLDEHLKMTLEDYFSGVSLYEAEIQSVSVVASNDVLRKATKVYNLLYDFPDKVTEKMRFGASAVGAMDKERACSWINDAIVRAQADLRPRFLEAQDELRNAVRGEQFGHLGKLEMSRSSRGVIEKMLESNK